jgi:hypothetical protein
MHIVTIAVSSITVASSASFSRRAIFDARVLY